MRNKRPHMLTNRQDSKYTIQKDRNQLFILNVETEEIRNFNSARECQNEGQ
jgi:hypothetical protein